MRNVFRLSKEEVDKLVQVYGTPLLVLSNQEVKKNYRFLREHLPQARIHYAMKANPAEGLLRTLVAEGSCFDVASDGEIRQLGDMGVSGERMVYANPIKTEAGLLAASEYGVKTFTFDSESEIEKMAKLVPDGRVLLRVRIENPQAHVDLNKKFGAYPDDALSLLVCARQAGLVPVGLCFHVGSQYKSSQAYVQAIEICHNLFIKAREEGLSLQILDIGGGFPIPEPGDDFDVVPMLADIRQVLEHFFPNTEIWSEPGRFLCGTAVNLVTKVIGCQQRNNEQWYFLDEGIYGTFSGVIFDQWDFELESFSEAEPIYATFAGPSCDSLDIMFRNKMTPPLAMGDILRVCACGAYTSASSTVFNGFSKARYVEWEEVRTIF